MYVRERNVAVARPVFTVRVSCLGLFFILSNLGGVFAGVELEKIVITPSRTEESLEEGGSNTEVINSSYFDNKVQNTLTDALDEVTGIDVVGGGKFGSVSEGIYIRGALPRHTAYMLEGVKIYDPSNPSSYYVPSDLLLGGISKIEVVKTPLSTLYGSSPLGGAVNFFIKTPRTKPYLYYEQEGGSFYTTKEIAEAGGRLKGFSYLFNVERLDSDAFSKAREKNNNPENDPYQNTSMTMKLEYAPDNEFEAGFFTRALHSRTKADDDDNFDGLPEDDLDNLYWNNELVSSIYAKKKLNDYLSLKLQAGHTSIFRRTRDDGEEYVRDWYRGKTYQFLSNIEIEPWDFYKIVTGFDYTLETAQSYSNYSGWTSDFKRSSYSKGYFLENIIRPMESLRLDFSYRMEQHPLFKSHSVIKGGISYKVPVVDTELHSSYSEGFKTPSIYQLYGPSGNTSLRPEQSRSWDVGLNQPIGKRLILSLAYFHYNFIDLIDFVYSDPLHYIGRYENAAKGKSRGLEFQAKFDVSKKLKLRGGYTYLEARQDFVDQDFVTVFSHQTLRVPKHKISLGFDLNFGKLSLYTDLNYITARQDRIWKTVGWTYFDEFVVLKPYLLGNITADYKLSNNATVFLKVNNVFNRDYQRIAGYQEEKTGVYGGFKLRF